MRPLLLLLLSLPLCAQVGITISPPQPSRIPGLTEYRAIVSNAADTPLPVYGMTVYEAAAKAGVIWIADVGILEHVRAVNSGWNFWRVMGIVCEIGGYAGSVALVGRLAEIRERAAIAFPAAAGACTFGRALYNREHKDVEIPRDLLPPLLTVPARSRVDYAIYGR